jgi:hypothetical protein
VTTPEAKIKEGAWRGLTPEQRFHRGYVVLSCGCWVWTKYSDVTRNVPATNFCGGYGALWFAGKKRKTHQVSWLIHHGAIPAGMCVLHTCDVPECVNPDHLYIGTKADNAADMLARNRGGQHKNPPRGDRRYDSKLHAEDVLTIRSLCAEGLSQSKVAARFNISQTAVHKIVHRHRWAHI